MLRIDISSLHSSSAVEVPSYFIGWYIMDKWGRRWILFGTMMIGGLSCISCIFVPVGESFYLSGDIDINLDNKTLIPGGPSASLWSGNSTLPSPSQSSTSMPGSWCRQWCDLRLGCSVRLMIVDNDCWYSGDGSFFICCWYWSADISLHQQLGEPL